MWLYLYPPSAVSFISLKEKSTHTHSQKHTTPFSGVWKYPVMATVHFYLNGPALHWVVLWARQRGTGPFQQEHMCCAAARYWLALTGIQCFTNQNLLVAMI